MKNGCNNRPRPAADSTYIAQSGWIGRKNGAFSERVPLYVEVKAAFGSTECKYDASTTDPGCSGCQHRRAA